MKRLPPEMRTPFDPRLTKRLIDAVKASPALYDPSHADAKDLAVKAELWTSITLQLGYESGDEHIIKTRWKNIRDSYLKYKRITWGSDSSSISKNYKNWPWAPYMDFMENFYERVATGTKRRVRCHNYSAGGGSGQDSDDVKDLDVAEEPEEVDVKPPRMRRRRKLPEPTLLASSRPLRRKARRLDSVDLLFQSYAQTMKSFSAKRRALLKMHLSNMFAQAEIEELEEGVDGEGDPLVGEPDDDVETDPME